MSERERVLAFVLLIVTLACAIWLGMHPRYVPARPECNTTVAPATCANR